MSDPKEALERLKAFASCAHVDTDAGREAQTCVVSLADLRTLIAKQEGLEREVADALERIHSAEARSGRNLARAEAAEAKLSALQAAMELVQARALKDSNAAIHSVAFTALRALLPTVPVEEA